MKEQRNEREMMELLVETARQDSRILAAYMNGSRTNPNAPRDRFQDYDVMYVVKETASFREDGAWIDRFGERLYMQYPEDSELFPGNDIENCWGWLIQFTDWNRLDLHVETVEHMERNIRTDRLCKVLLDKAGILPEIPPSTDADFWIQKPREADFLAACNEFWWCLNNIGKGLWREEIPYAMDMLNLNVRPMLTKLLEWRVGIGENFAVSAGKSSKYLYRWLPEADWKRYLQTYPAGETEKIWDAVFVMCTLFDETAKGVAQKLGFAYDAQEAENSLLYLKEVRSLETGG